MIKAAKLLGLLIWGVLAFLMPQLVIMSTLSIFLALGFMAVGDLIIELVLAVGYLIFRKEID